MVTTYTKSVGTTARDYATLTLAEADIASIATSADLVTNDEAVVFECYNDSTFTESCAISGTTCDATRNVTFIAATGERHTGVRNTGVRNEALGGHGFDIYDDHIVIEGFEVKTDDGGSDECIRVRSGVIGLIVDGCILEPHATQTSHDGVYTGNWDVGSATYPLTIRNCLFHGFDRGGVHLQSYNIETHQYVNVINCTFVDCSAGVRFETNSAGSTLYLKAINCIGSNNGLDFYERVATGTHYTTGSASNFGDSISANFPDNTVSTMTDDTNPGAGTWTIVEDHTGADYTAWDLRLVDDTDNDAQDAGDGPTANALVPEHDAILTARSGSTTDLGFYQVSGGAPPATRRVFVIS